MRSPCLGCAREMEDKAAGRCLVCTAPGEYAAALGGMTHSVPIELTGITGGGMGGERKAVSSEDREAVRSRMAAMKPKEIAAELGWKMARVYRIINALRIEARRNEGSEKDIAAGSRSHSERQQQLPLPAADALAAVFAGRPRLLEKLQEMAERHFRTPEMELYRMVTQAYDYMLGHEQEHRP